MAVQMNVKLFTFCGSEYEPSMTWRGFIVLMDAARTLTS